MCSDSKYRRENKNWLAMNKEKVDNFLLVIEWTSQCVKIIIMV